MREPSHRAARGFSLIELMIAMSLGTLLLAGAFIMHAAFSKQSVRQQEIGDMQQGLRVASEMMVQAIRNAGQGMNGGTMNVAAQSTCTAMNYYPVEFSNSNVYKDPRLSQADYDVVGGDTDTDPDWLRVVAIDVTPRPDGTPSMVEGQGFDTANSSAIEVPDTSLFPANSFVYVFNSSANEPQVCVRQVTATLGTALPAVLGTANKGGLIHLGNCYNPTNETAGSPSTGCLGTVAPVSPGGSPPGTYMFRKDGSVVFRVDQSDPKTPKLMVAYAPQTGAPLAGTAPANMPWQILAENIEDLQVALILTDGTICGALGNSVDGPNPYLSPRTCGAADSNIVNDANNAGGAPDPATVRVAAVRFTLTARSSNVVSGFAGGTSTAGIQSTKGGFEDEPATTVSDGYLRRSLTTEVELRSTTTQ